MAYCSKLKCWKKRKELQKMDLGNIVEQMEQCEICTNTGFSPDKFRNETYKQFRLTYVDKYWDSDDNYKNDSKVFRY